MAVTKVNGFDVPYRSQTFQNQANKIEQTSGLLMMDGVITTDSGNVYVPPFDFIQNGLIVCESTQRTIPDPSKPAPYYLTVNAATTAIVDDLSFQFPRSPDDISDNQVIIGYWDGNEWRKPQLVSINEVYKDINQANVDYSRVGPFSGLLTSQAGANYSTTPGILTDREGLRQKLIESFVTPIIADDPDFDRVDRIIYRRPKDSEKRIGVRKFVLGGTHDTSLSVIKSTQFLPDTAVESTVKVLVGSDNTAYLLVAEGYGVGYQIVFVKYSSDRTVELVGKTVLVSTLDNINFSARLDSSDNIHIAYTNGGDLYWAKYSATGVEVVSPKLVHNHAYGEVSNPAMVYSSELDSLFILTQILLGPSDSKIWFQSLQNNDSGLNPITLPTQLTLINGNLINPDLFMSDDLDIHVVAEDVSTARVCVAKYDDIAAVISPAQVISGNTSRIGYGTLVGGAKNPKVFATDNKDVYVTFLQNKGASQYGLTIWSSISGAEGTAFMKDIVSPTENFSCYDATHDDFMNGVHLILNDGVDNYYAKFESQDLILSSSVATVTTNYVSIARDMYGSMLHAWSNPPESTFTDYATGVVLKWLGAQTVIGALNTYYLTADQLVVSSSLVSPKVGDQVEVANASDALNNGNKIITAVELLSVNAADDYYLVTFSTSFNSPEVRPPSLMDAAFRAPDGNSCYFVKTNSELTSLAYRFDVLPTDVLLARLSLPGPVILNYAGSGVGPIPSGTDKLLAHSTDLILDWEFSNPGCLTTTGNFQILDLVNNYNYTIPAGITSLSEGDALYVELNLVNPAPSFQVAPVATLPFSSSIQVIGVVKGGWFVPHSLLSSLDVEELEPGEVVSVGHDLPDLIRERLGIISDTQYEIYYSVASGLNPDRPPKIIMDTDNYPKAISRLDAAVYDIQQDYNQEETFVVTTPITQYQSSVMTWDPDNTKYDILVWVNGKKQTQDPAGGLAKDFFKYDVDIVRFSYTIPVGAEVTIFKVRKGGGSAGFLVGKDEGVQVTPYAKVINFIGDGVTATNGGVGQLNVTIPGGPAYQNLTKFYRNGTGGIIPANTAVAFDSLGNIVLADANIVSLSDFAGVTKNAIDPSNYGEVYKLGDCPDVILSLGAVPGDFVYLGEVPGSLSLIPPPLLTDTIIIVGRAEPKNATFPDGTATSLYLNPQLVSGA